MGSGPTDKKVTFARDETSLLAQLKALVLEFETGSKGNLLSIATAVSGAVWSKHGPGQTTS